MSIAASFFSESGCLASPSIPMQEDGKWTVPRLGTGEVAGMDLVLSFGTGNEEVDTKVRKETTYDKRLKILKFDGFDPEEEEYKLMPHEHGRAADGMLRMIEQFYDR
jgi:hypothetical protein